MKYFKVIPVNRDVEHCIICAKLPTKRKYWSLPDVCESSLTVGRRVGGGKKVSGSEVQYLYCIQVCTLTEGVFR